MKRTFVIALAVTLGLFVAGTAIAARNSSGTYSLPNSPVQAGQTITATWANSTLSDIKTELTDSLSRSGKGGMTAPLRTADGSSSFPAHSFTSETGSGLYRAGSSDVRFAMGAADIQTWTPTGVTITPSVTFSTTVTIGGNASVSGTLNMNSHQINNVTNPAAAQDAVTLNFLDTARTTTWTTITIGGTGCSNGAVVPAYTLRSGMVHFRGSVSMADTATVCTFSALAAGARPASATSFPGRFTGITDIVLTISAAGAISHGSVASATSSALYLDGLSFPAEQ